MLKRTLAIAALVLVPAVTVIGVAWGQGRYPSKAIEVVVPFAPGGGTDNLVRTIVALIDENKWSPQAFNVVNRPGGSGAVGYTYLINKKGNPHVVAGATPFIVSGKIDGRLTGNHRDVMTILTIMLIIKRRLCLFKTFY